MIKVIVIKVIVIKVIVIDIAIGIVNPMPLFNQFFCNPIISFFPKNVHVLVMINIH